MDFGDSAVLPETGNPLIAVKRTTTNPTKEHEKSLRAKKPFLIFVAPKNQSNGIPQISRAYSRMVRSLENFPIRATLRMDLRIHFG